MEYLIKSCEQKEKIEILLSLARFTSENTICAITDYYCTSFSKTECAELHDIKLGNLSRDIKKFNAIVEMYEKAK